MKTKLLIFLAGAVLAFCLGLPAAWYVGARPPSRRLLTDAQVGITNPANTFGWDEARGVSSLPIATRVRRLEELVANVDARMELDGKLLEELQRGTIPGHTLPIDVSSEAMVNCPTVNGPISVSVMSADPFLDGYKLRLRIGNPTAAVITGCSLIFKWGDIFDELGETNRHRENIAGGLPAGSWKETESKITPLSLQDLKTLRVGVTTRGISLKASE